MSQTIKIVSFNLRSQYTGDGINAFIHRAGMIYDKIKKEAPDIVAFQEVIEPHYDVLPKLMPDYTFLGQFRNADYTGEGVFTLSVPPIGCLSSTMCSGSAQRPTSPPPALRIRATAPAFVS